MQGLVILVLFFIWSFVNVVTLCELYAYYHTMFIQNSQIEMVTFDVG